MKKNVGEIFFLIIFFLAVIGFYLIYKYPTWFVQESEVVRNFYWFGKSTGFWYSTVYTFVVCGIAIRVVLGGLSPYGKNKKKAISPYQRYKFITIFISQLVFFYLVPYIFPYFGKWDTFFSDRYQPVNKDAYVYVYNGFTSLGGFLYIFVLIPLTIWFFGKRYCSWFCACGNLAETVGVTKWGNRWVTKCTPRSEFSRRLEIIQYVFLFFSLCFGLVLLLDAWEIIIGGKLLFSMRAIQDLVIDLIFGALIGVGAYPILGTRIWCRYGCPLAAGMRFVGKISKSRFQVLANENCKGLNLCTTQCPMGIDVARYAHKNKIPTRGHFGLEKTPCIGCGGCIDICPVQALTFKKILNH